ncbi:MAG: hypothetical protein HC916_05705 [Coleofasciculaceae cyanobacterium SM2_1_6]|nr:hypothetical protein [Coleofasciculaceae cyanobacterium SM2_1_6]
MNGSRSIPLIASLLCLMLAGCQTPEEIAQEKLAKEQKAKAEEAALAEKKALEELESQSDKFAAIAPPVNEVAEPYVKGKVIFVYKRAGNKSEFLPADRADLGELYAKSVAEVGTVVQVNCFNIRQGEYIREKTQEKIPAFIVRCEVDLIDNTIPTVIARKEFINDKLPDTTTIKPGDTRIVAISPYKEIRDFIRNLPRQ